MTSLIGLIVMSSGTMMWQVSGSRQRMDQSMRLNADADASIRAITTSLANIYRSAGNDRAIFIGEDDQASGFDTDRLRLHCVSHIPIRPGEPESDVRLVEFMLTDTPDGSSTALSRRTDPTRNEPDDEGGVIDLIASNVISLNFEYFDGLTWQTYWPESMGQPPTAVRVTVALADPDRPYDITGLTRTVSLPWMPGNNKSTGGQP